MAILTLITDVKLGLTSGVVSVTANVSKLRTAIHVTLNGAAEQVNTDIAIGTACQIVGCP